MVKNKKKQAQCAESSLKYVSSSKFSAFYISVSTSSYCPTLSILYSPSLGFSLAGSRGGSPGFTDSNIPSMLPSVIADRKFSWTSS